MSAAQRLLDLYRQHWAIEHEALEVAKLAYPLDTTVYWLHGDHTRRGVVVGHGNMGGMGGVRVKNPSGGHTWVDVYKLLDAQFGAAALAKKWRNPCA